MKGIVLALASAFSFATWAAPHPASQFVQSTLAQGKQILELKDQNDRLSQFCSFMDQNLHLTHISSAWLGSYKDLAREQAAVQEFRRMVPSILISKVGGTGGGALDGTFQVSPDAEDRGDGVFAVSVTIETDDNSYTGDVVVIQDGASFKGADLEYMGFSGVEYMAGDYQNILDEEYNRDPSNSMPVSHLIETIRSEQGYISCP